MRWSPPAALIPLFAFACVALASTEAFAQPPQADKIVDGPFVYAAPAGVAAAFGDGEANFADRYIDESYMTQLGGGYLIRRGNFIATFGADMEFVLYDMVEPGDLRSDGFMLRLLPDIRLGGGNDWLFIYGFVRPGFAISHVDWRVRDCNGFGNGRNPFPDCRDDDYYDSTEPGFNMGTGGGAMVKLWRGLGVGAEGGVDLAFFDDDNGFHFERVFMFDFIAYAGWWF